MFVDFVMKTFTQVLFYVIHSYKTLVKMLGYYFLQILSLFGLFSDCSDGFAPGQNDCYIHYISAIQDASLLLPVTAELIKMGQ